MKNQNKKSPEDIPVKEAPVKEARAPKKTKQTVDEKQETAPAKEEKKIEIAKEKKSKGTQGKKKKKSLDEIGVEFGTDKSSLLHDYLNEYEKVFAGLRDVKKVVEIGIQRTSGKWKDSTTPSIKMLREFFPDASIFGFDQQELASDDDRVKFFKGQQGRMKHHIEFSLLTGEDIDLVIDDASHRFPDQLLSFLFLFQLLKSGGVYIIEDTNAVVQNEYKDDLKTVNGIERILSRMDSIESYSWISSKSAGEKSSLIIIKK